MTIKIITEPKVYLIGVQELRTKALDAFLTDNGSAEWEPSSPSAGCNLAEIGGRLCYDSFRSPRPGGNAAYLARIKSEAHGSVLEHAVFTVIITGISRSLSHELVRHRVGLSPSQRSQRYVDESDVAFVLPPAILMDSQLRGGCHGPAWAAWEKSCEDSLKSYEDICGVILADPAIAKLEQTDRRKVARQTARSVLPECTETKIQLTGNARAWRHLIEQRGSAGADSEIRRLAFVLLKTFANEAPAIFGDYTTDMAGPVVSILTPHRKV